MKTFKQIGLYLIFLSLIALNSCTDSETIQKNEVNIRIEADPGGLSIYLGSSGYATQVSEHIFSTMLHLDPKTSQPSPVLAVSLPEISQIDTGVHKGHEQFTFEIHKEAVWDDGSPVLASDCLFTLKAGLNPLVKTRYKGYFGLLSDFIIDPGNPKKFTIIAQKHMLGMLISGGIYFYPEYMYDPAQLMRKFSYADLLANARNKEWAQENPDIKVFAEQFMSDKHKFDPAFISSCGPYKVEEYIPQQKIVLKKKENWWGDKLASKYPLLAAKPDRLIYKPIKDLTTALSSLKEGSVDVVARIDPNTFIELKNNSSIDNLNFYTPDVIFYDLITLNSLSPKLEDKKTRRAIAHLVNVDLALENIMKGLAIKTNGPIHPSKPYYDHSIKQPEFNPQLARKLLEEAGWEDSNNNQILDKKINGQTVELELKISIGAGSSVGKPMALLLKEVAEKVGVKIVLDEREFNLVLNDMKTGNFEMAVHSGQGLPILDDLYNAFHSSRNGKNGRNYTGFANARADELIEVIRETKDEKKLHEMYLEIQKIIDNERTAIYLFAPTGRIAINKRFDNCVTGSRRPGYFENYFTVTK